VVAKRSCLLLLGALIVPLAATIAATQLRYAPQMLDQDASTSTIGALVGLFLGTTLLLLVPFRGHAWRLAVVAAYLIGMYFMSMFAALMTACGNGDCL